MKIYCAKCKKEILNILDHWESEHPVEYQAVYGGDDDNQVEEKQELHNYEQRSA